MRRLAVFALLLVCIAAPVRAQPQSFAQVVAKLWPDAQAKGITRATFDLALKGVTPDPRVIAATKRQPEYGKPVGAYVNDAVSRSRIANGQRKATEWAKTFDAVEKKFGVERWVLIALWGMETDYGHFIGAYNLFASLATQASDGARGSYARRELIAALQILQQRNYPVSEMVSSWAGAFGQTQFLPTTFFKYATDGDGDGRIDLWRSPADALASTAVLLARAGWQTGRRRGSRGRAAA